MEVTTRSLEVRRDRCEGKLHGHFPRITPARAIGHDRHIELRYEGECILF